MCMNDEPVNIEEIRFRERIREAVRARKFTSVETLNMGFSLIDFSLKFRKVCDDAFNKTV